MIGQKNTFSHEKQRVRDSALFNNEPLIRGVTGIRSNTKIRKDIALTVLCRFVELSSTEAEKSSPCNIAG